MRLLKWLGVTYLAVVLLLGFYSVQAALSRCRTTWCCGWMPATDWQPAAGFGPRASGRAAAGSLYPPVGEIQNGNLG